jgi:hypothetical protein
MTEHRVPRWIDGLWLAIVAGLILTSIDLAVQSNCGFIQTVGFLAASSFVIFPMSVVAYLLLYGLSILLEGVEYHKTHCDDSKHSAGMADFMR